MSDKRVYRWRVGAVATAALVALALLYASPLLIASAVIPLVYVVYGALSTVPTDAAVRVERSFGDATPPPGEDVTVTLTVENDSARTLPDVRVVDGVPDDLAVTAGSPRACTSLRPGESTTVTYDVVTGRGTFDFADPVVRLRSFSAGRIVTETVPVDGQTSLSSLDPVSAPAVGTRTTARAGTHPTDSGGEGLEFHSTREYRPGDAISRIDWRRFGKTGDLTTVSFREERAVRVVLVVDARPPGRVRLVAGAPTAASLAGYAAERFYETLADSDVRTDLATFGVDGSDPAVPTGAGPVPWVSGDRRNARAVARSLFDTVQSVTDDGARGPSANASATVDVASVDEPVDSSSPSASKATDPATGGDESGAERAADRSLGTTDAESPGEPPERTAPDGGDDAVRVLLSQFPSTAHVLFVSPVRDDWPIQFVRRVRRRGYPVTVFSPGVSDGDSNGDSTGGPGRDSLGAAVTAHERAVRLSDLSTLGATVVDWDRSESMARALAAVLASLPGGGRG